jgi:hypothetical protein
VLHPQQQLDQVITADAEVANELILVKGSGMRPQGGPRQLSVYGVFPTNRLQVLAFKGIGPANQEVPGSPFSEYGHRFEDTKRLAYRRA